MPERIRRAFFRDAIRQVRWPRLTPARALAVLTGAVAVQALPSLLLPACAPLLTCVALACVFFSRSDRLPVWFILGFAWTVVRADAVLQARLPELWHGRDFVVSGVVRDLPQTVEGSTRFDFEIDGARLDGAVVDVRGLARINWYVDAPTLEPCSRWTLTLRLRPARGLVNPGGFDSERSAVQRGRIAVGYVRTSSANQQQAAGGGCIDGWRQAITRAIGDALGTDSAATLLRALAVGDQTAISEDDWQVLRATGIGHLIAISGLHVGMFAAFGAWLARRLWKAWPRLTLRMPGPLIEAPFAIGCALGYGLLAGMGVPTVRTLLMISVALFARCMRRASSVTQALGFAALVIMLWDPLAVLAPGFWLSFLGVAILLSVTSPVGDERPPWRDMPRVQWLLSLALLPLTVWFFGQASLIGPLANLLAVPWISFVVVPVTVVASLVVVWAPAIGVPLLHFAEALLTPLWDVMRWMAALPSAQRYFAVTPVWTFALALVGIAWSLMPRGVPLRGLGMLLALPMLMPLKSRLVEAEFEVWMFDVGQGLSMLVRTRDHALLYDAGARYAGGFDVGDAVVIPALHALGVEPLDRIMISHGDNDHAGGARAVSLAYPYAVVDSGEPARLKMPARTCSAGETWRWDGVDFRVLSPPAESRLTGNDRSCVLAISSMHGSVLLTGDISAAVEPAMPALLGPVPRPLLISVAHHGSRTASTAPFLDDLDPDLAWVSAGYRNRFGHPHTDVVARYVDRDIVLSNTADSGYLHIQFAAIAGAPERGRDQRLGWWRMH